MKKWQQLTTRTNRSRIFVYLFINFLFILANVHHHFAVHKEFAKTQPNTPLRFGETRKETEINRSTMISCPSDSN